MNKITKIIGGLVIVGFALGLGVFALPKGEPYKQVYPIGTKYVVRAIAGDGTTIYEEINENQYKDDPVNKNKLTFTKQETGDKEYPTFDAAKLEVYGNSTTTPLSEAGWMDSGTYLFYEDTEGYPCDKGTCYNHAYIVCHSGVDCSGNGNREIYNTIDQDPVLEVVLESHLPWAVKKAFAAVAHNSTTSSTMQSSVASYSFSHTNAAVSNGLLTLCTGQQDNTDADRDITAVTYNSVSMNNILTYSEAGSANIEGEAWQLIGASTGSNTMAITYAGTVTLINAFATTWSGVDQTTPIGASNATNVLNTDPWQTSLTNNNNDSVIVDCKVMGSGGGAETFSAVNFTGIGNEAGSSLNNGIAYVQATTSPTLSTWDCTGTFCANRDWASGMFELIAAAGAGGAVSPEIWITFE